MTWPLRVDRRKGDEADRKREENVNNFDIKGDIAALKFLKTSDAGSPNVNNIFLSKYGQSEYRTYKTREGLNQASQTVQLASKLFRSLLRNLRCKRDLAAEEHETDVVHHPNSYVSHYAGFGATSKP